MDATQILLIVLAAVALGALLPLAFQLTLTIRAARRFLSGVEPRLNGAIEEISAAAVSVDHALSALDASALQRTAESVGEIGSLAKNARELATTIGMASAVGAAAAPAVAALIRAWQAPTEPVEIRPEQPAHQATQDEGTVSIHAKERIQR